jgi:hypothetical protein
VLGYYQKRSWNGSYGEIYTYRYANKLPLRGDQETIEVNWCELTITREDSGEQLTKNAIITDFQVLETTVEAIVLRGRTRPKSRKREQQRSKKPKAITWNTILATAANIWPPFCSV